MKPEVSKETVFDGKVPRFVTARRFTRRFLGPVPLVPVNNRMPSSERRRPGVPALTGEAMSIARVLRTRVDSKILQEGAVVVPKDLPFTMAVAARAIEETDSTVTDARVSIVPLESSRETGLIVHADEPKDDSGSSSIELVRDASVMICDPDSDRQFGIGDFSPIERPAIRQVVNMAVASLAGAPQLKVYPEGEILLV